MTAKEEDEMEEAMIDEASLVREAEEEEEITSETHAAKWARPQLKLFNPRETTITFQARELYQKCVLPNRMGGHSFFRRNFYGL